MATTLFSRTRVSVLKKMITFESLRSHRDLNSPFPGIKRVEMSNAQKSVAMDFPERMYDERMATVEFLTGHEQSIDNCIYAANGTVVSCAGSCAHVSCGGLMTKVSWKSSTEPLRWECGDSLTLVVR